MDQAVHVLESSCFHAGREKRLWALQQPARLKSRVWYCALPRASDINDGPLSRFLNISLFFSFVQRVRHAMEATIHAVVQCDRSPNCRFHRRSEGKSESLI